jgi:hypothetical protein
MREKEIHEIVTARYPSRFPNLSKSAFFETKNSSIERIPVISEELINGLRGSL